MTSAADLLALQEIDLRRDGRRALVADIDSRLGETEELLSAREQVESARAEVERLAGVQRDIETQLEDLEAKIKPIETRLYDGSVRNPKELTDLQRDLDHLKGRRRQLDDRGLEAMEAAETAAAALAAARAGLQQIEREWSASQAGLQEEQAAAESEIQRLQQDRDARSAGMDKAALSLYESLRGQKQGRAVALVERGACQGCRLSLPTHLVQRVRAGNGLAQCPSCERILVAG